MLIILVTSIGLAIFALFNKHCLTTALAFGGPSRTVGMVLLVAAGVLLIVRGQLWVGLLPVALVTIDAVPVPLAIVNSPFNRARNPDEKWHRARSLSDRLPDSLVFRMIKRG